MNPKLLMTMAAVTLLPQQPLSAALTFYASRGDFNTAYPLAITEDFENLADSTLGFTGPLNSLTSVSGLIETGDINSLFNFSSQSNNMFVAGSGSSSNPTTAIGSNFPSTDSIRALFGTLARSFAVDLFQNIGGGDQSGGFQPFTITLFDGAVSVGSAVASVPSGAVGFFGVASTVPFDRVDIRSGDNLYEVIDNVSISVVPEPSAALLAALCPALFLMRRCRRHSSERLAPVPAPLE